MVKLKRIYEKAEANDGYRILVDRIWPRGISKEKAHLDLWLKEIGPSDKLRKWFNHEVEKWEEFEEKYKKELRQNPSPLNQLQEILKKERTITLLYGAKDTQHNQAVVLLNLLI
jgi:uncharacterized protein YeaO (DUF488 family)